jgi:hypothetical protein
VSISVVSAPENAEIEPNLSSRPASTAFQSLDGRWHPERAQCAPMHGHALVGS